VSKDADTARGSYQQVDVVSVPGGPAELLDANWAPVLSTAKYWHAVSLT
jgi:putative intracellular protease/amidase